MARNPIELTGERVILREFRLGDAPRVHQYASDLEVVRYMPWGPNNEEQTAEFIERSLASQDEEPRVSFEFAVTLRDGGKLIGGSGIRLSGPANRSGDMGYCLRRDAWGQGYGTETARLLVTFGFEDLDLHRIWATCDAENVASAQVLEKVGMTREGHMRDDSWIRGRWRSSYLYAILEDDRA